MHHMGQAGKRLQTGGLSMCAFLQLRDMIVLKSNMKHYQAASEDMQSSEAPRSIKVGFKLPASFPGQARWYAHALARHPSSSCEDTGPALKFTAAHDCYVSDEPAVSSMWQASCSTAVRSSSGKLAGNKYRVP